MMKPIEDFYKMIHKEQHLAKKYAEKYIMNKAEGNMPWAKAWHDMAMQNLDHAERIYKCAVDDMNKLKATMTPTYDMEEMWEKCHKEYVDRMAKIKQMLTM